MDQESQPQEQNPNQNFEAKIIKPKKSFKQTVYDFYDKKYKILLVIPFLMLAISLAILGFKFATTGEIIPRDVSLKGGVILTIPYQGDFDSESLESYLSSKFSQNDVGVRVLKDFGRSIGIIVEADIIPENEQIDLLMAEVGNNLGIDISTTEYGLETVGSSLGESFFNEALKALLIAFVFMGLVIFIYFRTIVPSVAIILAAVSDMVVALAVINIFQIKIGTAGIAAFLMLIGYSVDTDVLLTVRVLKRKEGTVMDRIMSSVNTGMTMTLTGIVAIIIALLVTQSEIIKQIMLILLIGLLADLVNTWIQNVGLLRLYIERRRKKGKPI
tara:strand:- start:2306 stop:3292 length:987 start_codon:yes stop_codon:yes gene_type:complete